MLSNFKVTRTSEDALSEQTWTFTVLDLHGKIAVIIDEYTYKTRPSKRHQKFTTSGSGEFYYYRLSNKNAKLPESAVPFPADVAEEARQRVVEHIKVGLWADFKGDF